MSITHAGISYAENFEYNTSIGIIGGGIAYYDEHRDYWYDFTDATLLRVKIPDRALHPTEYNVANRELIYKFNNGVKVYITPWVETEHIVRTGIEYDKFTYHGRLEYVTPSGVTVVLTGNPEFRYTWTSQIGGGRAGWGIEYVYSPTITTYPDDPVTTDLPNYIYLGGESYFPKTYDSQFLNHAKISFRDLEDEYQRMGQLYVVTNDKQFDDWFGAIEEAGDGKPIHEKSDPQKDDPSQGGGNDGRYDPWGTGDTSQVAGLPTTDVGSTGLMTLYNPSSSQLRALSNFLWSDGFIDTIKKLKNDPFESIIGLNMLPFAPITSGSENIVIGNCDSEVSAPLCSQYKQINCGAIQILESWGSFLDYSPYTRIEIFLPFVGMRTLKTDDVMGKSVGVVYNIDCVTGSAMCCVTANGNVLYTFNCEVAYHVPLTGSNMNEMIKGILTTVGVGIATAGVGASVGTAGGLLGSATAPYMGGAGLTIASALNVVAGKEHSVVRSGALSGSTGILGDLIPYVVIHRPIQSLPANFGHFKGFMSSITNSLGGFSGYTEVAYTHLDGVTATDEEKNEIMELLVQGVIV